MTIALCLNCGDTKFGAICPCPKCKVGSTGDIQLDILFSDHNFTVSTLENLGTVIKEIHLHCDNPDKCLWAFIHYISQKHPEILRVDLEPEAKQELQIVLDDCYLPVVRIVKKGWWNRIIYYVCQILKR